MADDVSVKEWEQGQAEANRTGRCHVLVGMRRQSAQLMPLDEVRFHLESNGDGSHIARPTIWQAWFCRIRRGK